jgi:hypothetical protein
MSGPSYAEITGAGKLLIEKSATFLKFVIFIDGIDEFDGEYKGVSEFFYWLMPPKVKSIISSRPINTWLHVFRKCPAFRLQNPNKKDMQVFVKGTFMLHPNGKAVCKNN